ncbi:TPA: hypothetical protein I2T90_06095 [Staphylococcus aureus]|nr:hypothetical protein CU118_09965 [Staphylococcus aureus]MCO4456636.1 hypothetical protein [Staphylococcus aureus]MSN56124.1 hypothetical protein [Staphylococcus aureus]MSN61259.1 hypothetical protein [Staphylococcus aureus]MSN63750.1 hypothetical protein [Staphylococcus aureus]
MQVGGAPTQKLTAGQLTVMCKLGSGPQKRMILNSMLPQHLLLFLNYCCSKRLRLPFKNA